MDTTAIIDAIRFVPAADRYGRVVAVTGLMIEVAGLGEAATMGARLTLESGDIAPVEAEIVALADGVARCLAFEAIDGLSVGARATVHDAGCIIHPCAAWRGRVVDGLGRPLDGKGPLPHGRVGRPVRAAPPPAAARNRIGGKLSTGVDAIDLFAPLCRGQRLALFDGADGAGAAALLAMLARHADSDINVIGLIGDTSRDVQALLSETLSAEALARSIVVVATADMPAMMRRQAAWLTLAIAEQFRDEGRHVLCLFDSIARFAEAQRDIGQACGETIGARGFPATVFAELPRLLERAGPGLRGSGAISAVFAVGCKADDYGHAVADAARIILDGEIILSGEAAIPDQPLAIDALRSVSRIWPQVHGPREQAVLDAARGALSDKGDRAAAIAALLRQGRDQRGNAARALGALERIVGGGHENTL